MDAVNPPPEPARGTGPRLTAPRGPGLLARPLGVCRGGMAADARIPAEGLVRRGEGLSRDARASAHAFRDRPGAPPRLGVPPVEGRPRRRPGEAPRRLRPEPVDDTAERLPLRPLALRLPTQLRPRVRPRPLPGPGSPVPCEKPLPVQLERPSPARRQTPRRLPHAAQAEEEVAARSPALERPRAMRAAQPDRHPAGEGELATLTLTPPHADRTRRKRPERLPLVERLRHT
jgi:hypothetical protein